MLRIGGSIMTAATLLSEPDATRERNLVRGTLAKFGLNENDAVDALLEPALVRPRL